MQFIDHQDSFTAMVGNLGEVQPAELIGAIRATSQPENVVPVIVLGQFTAHPAAAGTFKAVKKGPFIPL